MKLTMRSHKPDLFICFVVDFCSISQMVIVYQNKSFRSYKKGTK